jgi:hypothetical protein
MPQLFKPYTKESQDGRRKLPTSEHEAVRQDYQSTHSQRETARHFNISRRLVVFILYPERNQQRQEANRKNKSHLKYYEKDKRKKAIYKYRQKKQALHLQILKVAETKMENPNTNPGTIEADQF